jgi:chaperonin GroEL (HSP60 family)
MAFQRPVSTRFHRVKGDNAWRQNSQVSAFIFDRVKTSFGPKGAYKIITYNKGPEKVVKLCKEVIPILEELGMEYPLIRILAEAAKMQKDEIGDGSTQFVLLTTCLIEKAYELIEQGVHANTIVSGYFKATRRAKELIDGIAEESRDYTLIDILDITDCKRGLLKPDLSKMIVEASEIATVNGKLDKEKIKILKKPGGKTSESTLIKGVILQKEKTHPNMSEIVREPRIALVSGNIGYKRLELLMRKEGPTPFLLDIQKPELLTEFKRYENELKTSAVKKIVDVGANVLICEQLIDDVVNEELYRNGIFTVDRVDKEDTRFLAQATGANIVGTLDDLTEIDLGKAEEIRVGKIEPNNMVQVSGCNGATFIIRGSTSQALEEMQDVIERSVTLIKNSKNDARVLPGGGAMDLFLSHELKRYALDFPSEEQVVVESFAESLERMTQCLAENTGLDRIDIMTELKRQHSIGHNYAGVGLDGCEDAVCAEPAIIMSSIINRAYEVAALVIRIDELMISKEIAKFHKK